MPLRPYSTGLRVRLALGVVTSIEPEILLLSECIGVNAPFMVKAYLRLQVLVKHSDILMVCFELETSGAALDNLLAHSQHAPAELKIPEELKDQREPHPKRVILFIQESHLLPIPLAKKVSQPAETDCCPTPKQPRGKSNLWNLQ